jgi:hypothetical protein
MGIFANSNPIGYIKPDTCFNETCPPSASELLKVPGEWSGAELAKSEYWGIELSELELAELDAALQVCKASPTFELVDGFQPMGVTQENFPLQTLGLKITKEFAEGLENGPGVFMIKNFPTPSTSNGYSAEDIGIMYAGFNTYLGSWVPQSSAGLRSVSRGFGLPLGKVQAEMCGNTPLQGKQANNYFRLHTDRCDCITLMCIQKAPAGGLSRIASIPKIHNTMVNEYPDECARLYKPYVRIWEGKDGYFPLPVWSIHEGKFTSQVSPSYIENAQVLADFPEKYPGIPKYSEFEIDAVDLLEEIGCANSYDFMMEPGMVYWLNNHLVYHGRDSWKFVPESPENGRLMYRMWITPHNTRALPTTDAYKLVWSYDDTDESMGGNGIKRGGLEPCLKSTDGNLSAKAPELAEAITNESYVYYGLYKRKFGMSAFEYQDK